VLLPVELDAVLAARGFARLIVSGAQTDACIRSTLHGALTRGYDTVLVSDAHTTEDHTEWGAPPPEQVIAHTNLYWTYQTAPGRTAGTMKIRVPRRNELIRSAAARARWCRPRSGGVTPTPHADERIRRVPALEGDASADGPPRLCLPCVGE
jgi:hypothetical protein